MKQALLLAAALLALGLCACPGPLDAHGSIATSDPSEPSLSFQGPPIREVYAGQRHLGWSIVMNPTFTIPVPVKVRLIGPGTLTNARGVPLDLNSTNQDCYGDYVPPATVPPEGITVKIGIEVLSHISKRWEKSPDYEIRVLPRTTPMDFYFGDFVGADKGEATVYAGKELARGVTIKPLPAVDPRLQIEMLPPEGQKDLVGTLKVEPMDKSGFTRLVYTAPAQVAGPMDIPIRFRAYDPYVDQNRELRYVIHLMP